MKITATQLKKIIAEEVAKTLQVEAPESVEQNRTFTRVPSPPPAGIDPDALGFYKTKSYLLSRIQDRLEGVVDMLERLKAHESSAPAGDLDEIHALEKPLTVFEEELNSLIDAVDAML